MAGLSSVWAEVVKVKFWEELLPADKQSGPRLKRGDALNQKIMHL